MRAPFAGLTVLVVEDDWFVREDIANWFRQEGWTVLEAATGARHSSWFGKPRPLTLLSPILGWPMR
jgi:CheY-like chemotaxis protein